MKLSESVSAIVAIATSAALPAFAAEWFVSPGGDDDAAGTEAAPFRTIQFAVGAAAANDTITLLPGDYGAEQGTTNTTVSGKTSANRVVIDRKLTIRSRDGRDSTRIVGAWDTTESSGVPYGFGPDAVRCVWIAAAGSGTTLEGITFANGSVPAFASSNDYTAGGGVLVYGAQSATIADCAFIDCQGWNGGGLWCPDTKNSFRAVRCLFRGCRGAKFGFAMRCGAAYNCVFDDNGRTREKDGTLRADSAAGASGAFSYPHSAVNCTFVNNDTYGIGGYGTAGKAYNCLFMNNGTGSINTAYEKTYTNCVNDSSLTDGGSVSVDFTTSSEVYSPYDGDYRLVAGARSLTSGSATHLANIPEEFRGTDFCGNPRTTDGVVYCGAVQGVADAAASGVAVAYTADGDWYLDGERLEIRSRTWKAVEGWPVPRHVRFAPADGKALVRFSFGDSIVWPLPDDSAWFTTSRGGQVQTVSATATSSIFYADPANGSDSNAGTEAAPFKTLQAAVDAATSTAVVYARAGDYNEGVTADSYSSNRVAVASTFTGTLRVVAVDGPEETFISGLADPGTSNGTGGNAVRCISVKATGSNCAAFQGFTLRDGRTGANDSIPSQGAALDNLQSESAGLGTAFLLDCVVTNCSGNRAGCVAGGNAYRCRFEDCRTFHGGGQCVLRHCSVASSSFTGCGGSSELFGNTAKGYNCTIYGSSSSSIYNGSGVKGYLYNSVTGGRSGTSPDIDKAVTDDQAVNTLYSRLASGSTTSFTTAVCENPLKLLDGASGDYRLALDSAGLYLASTAYMQSCMDIDGHPFLFDTATGAYQAGCHALRAGATLYVDASGGSDANDGSSDDAAFQTLAAAMAEADYGDTVLALPGTYDAGTMLQTLAQSGGSAEPSLPARVVVKGGVTLASRDGASSAIIRGQTSSDASASAGCGPGAVRGVFLCRGAVLRGFTVTGGATLGSDDSAATVNDYGGGVAAYAGTAYTDEEFCGLVEDCVISNNAARSGGGGYYGTYRNCRITGNRLRIDKPGWAAARARLVGCLISGNGSSGNHSSIYGCEVVNCTVLGDQAGANSSSGVICNESGYANIRPVFNTIVTAGKIKANVCTNCLFGSGVGNLFASPAVSGIVVADANLDASGVPLAGSPAIDAGDNSLCPAALLAGFDPAGTRRLLNSTIDIGAYEYDWGVPWGAVIGNSRLVIDDMPSDAALSGNALVFGGSAVPVAMTWDKGGSDAAYAFTAQVTGAGRLTVTANDEPVATLTAANGSQAVSFASALANNALIFAYDGTEANGVILSAFSHQAPTMVIMR